METFTVQNVMMFSEGDRVVVKCLGHLEVDSFKRRYRRSKNKKRIIKKWMKRFLIKEEPKIYTVISVNDNRLNMFEIKNEPT